MESQASGRDDIDGYVNRISSKATVRDRRRHTHTRIHIRIHAHTHTHYRNGGKLQMDEIATFIMVLSPRSSMLSTHGGVSQGGSLASGGWAVTFTSYARICELRLPRGRGWDCRAVRQRTKHSVAQGSHDAALAAEPSSLLRVHLATPRPSSAKVLKAVPGRYNCKLCTDSTLRRWTGLELGSRVWNGICDCIWGTGIRITRTGPLPAGSSTESQKKQRHKKNNNNNNEYKTK